VTGGQRTNLAGYRRVLVEAVGLGLFTGAFGIAYLVGIDYLTEAMWGDEWSSQGWLSGSWWRIAIPVASGLLVGLIYEAFHLPSRFPGFIEDLEAGEVDPKSAPSALVIAVLTLVSGPSLGPEAPMGTAGGAAGTWLARRRGGDEGTVRQMSFIGISGAFGGLMSTPLGGPLLAFEFEHEQTHSYYFQNLVPGVVAGAVAFGVMWPVLGAPFEALLAIPSDEFRSWMLLAAVGLGALGAGAALVVGKLILFSSAMLRPLDARPVLRGVIGGSLVGALAFALPLTLFSGQTALPLILEDFEAFGISMLVALAFFKAAALGISLGAGFYGGPIFPTFFIGAVLGIAVHLLIPAVPMAVAVGSIMAALGAAMALLPISMAVLVAIMTQSGLEVFGAVLLASITAYAIRIALSQSAPTGDIQRSASTEGGL
jgi:H+/Cl- antiporter ClcA